MIIRVPVARPRVIRRRSAAVLCSAWRLFHQQRLVIDYAASWISQPKAPAASRVSEAGADLVFQRELSPGADAAVGGNLARFINHSCRPNCYAEIAGRTIWIRAARAIEPGEELTYDYATGGAARILCRCRQHCETVL
jgi:hypothetical protein